MQEHTCLQADLSREGSVNCQALSSAVACDPFLGRALGRLLVICLRRSWRSWEAKPSSEMHNANVANATGAASGLRQSTPLPDVSGAEIIPCSHPGPKASVRACSSPAGIILVVSPAAEDGATSASLDWATLPMLLEPS